MGRAAPERVFSGVKFDKGVENMKLVIIEPLGVEEEKLLRWETGWRLSITTPA